DGFGSGRLADDLSACRHSSAARAAAQWPAVRGDFQPDPDRALHPARVHFSRRLPRSVAARRDCGLYEARGPQAPRAGERDRTARPAAGVAALIRARKRPRRRSARGEMLLVSVTCRQTARIRGRAVLTTGANPKRAAAPRARWVSAPGAIGDGADEQARKAGHWSWRWSRNP